MSCPFRRLNMPDSIVLRKELTPESGSATHSSLSVQEKARQDLEKDIKRYENSIIDTKRRMNTLVRIACLPPELLTEIFVHYRNAVSPGYQNDSLSPTYRHQELTTPYRWIKITHVCHLWREAALAFPRLWGTIFLTSQIQCVQEMLRRAKQAPLTIQSASYLPPKETFEHVLQHLPRIVTFDTRMVPMLGHLGDGAPAPRLQTLILRSSFGYPQRIFPRASSDQLQDFFKRCDLPCLKTLDLEGHTLQWSTELLKPTLTHLRIHGIPPPEALTLNDILDALENMSMLEDLDLQEILPAVPEDSLDGVTRVVDLPHLKKLTIDSRVPCCRELLRRTSFPVTTKVVLSCPLPSVNAIDRLGQAISVKMVPNGPNSRPFRSVSIVPLGGSDGVVFTAWREPHPITQISTRSNLPEGDLKITFRPHHVAGLAGIQSVLSTVPTNHLQTLNLALRSRKHASKREFIAIFEALPELRELGVDRWSQSNLHRALEHRVYIGSGTTTKSGRRRKQPCVPKLEVLMLQDMFIGAPPESGTGDTVLAGLQKAFTARQKSKVQLEKLILHRCLYFTEGDEKAMQSIVGTVDWDRHGMGDGMHFDSETEDNFDYDPFDHADYDDDPFPPWDTDEEDDWGDEPLFAPFGMWF